MDDLDSPSSTYIPSVNASCFFRPRGKWGGGGASSTNNPRWDQADYAQGTFVVASCNNIFGAVSDRWPRVYGSQALCIAYQNIMLILETSLRVIQTSSRIGHRVGNQHATRVSVPLLLIIGIGQHMFFFLM